jgi:hypothetical protein
VRFEVWIIDSLFCCGASVKVWKSLLNVLRSFGSVRYGMVLPSLLRHLYVARHPLRSASFSVGEFFACLQFFRSSATSSGHRL